MGKKILIVEDEKTIVDILAFALKNEGYEIVEAYDGKCGLELSQSEKPDLVLLDVMLPFIDGFEVCRRIREADVLMPVIMLTAREDESDKVFGLESGADDYITKPFSMRELLARVKANMRRSVQEAAPGDENVIVSGGIVINLSSCSVYCDENSVELTQREYELLKFLVQRPDRVFSREELMEKVWNFEYFGDLRTVDVTVRRLREKIEPDPSAPEYIITKRGIGYLFAGKRG